jgi:hypothetical protein
MADALLKPSIKREKTGRRAHHMISKEKWKIQVVVNNAMQLHACLPSQYSHQLVSITAKEQNL